jgi:UDP-glucose 4-epimerase
VEVDNYFKNQSLKSLPNDDTSLLITGGCGFVGLNVVESLFLRGFRNLRIMDDLSVGSVFHLDQILVSKFGFKKEILNDHHIHYTLNRDSYLHFNFHLLVADITNPEDCRQATEGIRAVVHLAAQTGVIPSFDDPQRDCTINVLGTVNLLRACVDNDVSVFIFASSSALVGEQITQNENKNPQPLSPYGVSKLAGEYYCSVFGQKFGLKTCILRFSNLYGNYSTHKSSVIAKFLLSALDLKLLTIYGDGQQTRDFLHVSDVCKGIQFILSALDENDLQTLEKINGQAIHLASGRRTTVAKLVSLVQSTVERDLTSPLKILNESARQGEILHSYADISEARRLIGFDPQIDLEQGLSMTWEWFRQESTKG